MSTFVKNTTPYGEDLTEEVKFFDQEKRELGFSKPKTFDERFEEAFPYLKYRTKEGRLKNFSKSSFSKNELELFKEIILKKMEEAKKIAFGYDSLSKCNSLGEVGSRGKVDDAGSDSSSFIVNTKLRNRAVKNIENLKRALLRLETGKFGICKTTGKLINPYRLRITPLATERIAIKKQRKN